MFLGQPEELPESFRLSATRFWSISKVSARNDAESYCKKSKEFIVVQIRKAL